MARSQYKNNYYSKVIWKSILKKKLNKTIWSRLIFSRSSYIPKVLSNNKYFIYNGNIFNKLQLNSLIAAKKFGEFSVTKKPFFYPKKDKKKR